jgi:hypothetical protein
MSSLVALLASEARITSGVGASASAKGAKALIFLLDVTVAAKDVGDLLDVYVQDSIDGVIFTDLVRFTQVLGNAGAKKYYAVVNLQANPTTGMGPVQDCTMSAGARQGPCGSTIRPKFVITPDGDSTEDQSFTFELSMLKL